MVELSPPTRAQFKELCGKDERLIRWFERLAKLSGETTPDSIGNSELDAGSALAIARQAAASVARLEIQAQSNEALVWLTIP